ncbi:hypothetical protein D3C73_1531640 [compost metagenome]
MLYFYQSDQRKVYRSLNGPDILQPAGPDARGSRFLRRHGHSNHMMASEQRFVRQRLAGNNQPLIGNYAIHFLVHPLFTSGFIIF